MKKGLIALAVVVVLYPLIAWLMGFAIEHRVQSLAYQGELMAPQLQLVRETRHGILTTDANSSYELGSTLKITRHYHRGWFSSVDEAHVEISVAALEALPALRQAAGNSGSPAPDRPPVDFSLRTVIYHGPFCGSMCFALAAAETHVTFTGTLQNSLTRIFGNKEPVTIHSRFSFLGGGSATISSPAFERLQLDHDQLLGWSGIEGAMHYGPGQNWYDLTAAAPELSIEGAKGAVEINGISFDVHQKRVEGSLFEGDTRMQLKHMTTTGPDKAQRFSVDDLLLASHNHAQDRFMSMSYQLDAGAIHTQPLTVSGAHVDFSLKHLGLEPLEALGSAMRSPQQASNSLAAPGVPSRSALAAIRQPLAALLVQQPEMSVDRLSMATPQGHALVTGVIHLVGFTDSDLDTPALLISKLDMRLDITIDEAFLAGLPGAGAAALARLQPMADQGFMTRANGTLHTQFVFHGGQLTLNGKPFSPGVIAGSPAAVPPRGLPTPPGSPAQRSKIPRQRAGTVH